MKRIKLFEEFVNESVLNEAKVASVDSKDWDRMLDLVAKGNTNGETVAKLIKDKNKAMARFVAGLKLNNSPLEYKDSTYSPYGYSSFARLGELAIELGATPEEIQNLYNSTEVPAKYIEKLTKLAGKKLDNRFVGVISKTILDAGFDITYLPHNGNASTYDGKDAMSRSGRKWTIGYKSEISKGTNKYVFVFDAITDEGDGPTYYIADQSSDGIFTNLKYNVLGKNEFIARLKEALK